ncbi:MAG: UTP--glucose-1-phosphate uridylyltransferase [Desulfoplanes sp.]|nr:UTP--glucose-1-phosphate uridylyltransferase [Desulfoplanes sp.]MDD4650415.1 UTP--glucose-1-phosphate uridylyltransferase [Desulfoplanes sp.]
MDERSPLISFLRINTFASAQKFKPFELKMEAHGLPDIVINVTKYYYHQLSHGSLGKLTEQDIDPVSTEEIQTYAQAQECISVGEQALGKLAIIKLNGGSGTSMGLRKAKTLLPVKDGQTFLNIIVRQVLQLREKTGREIPLVFMNSFSTHLDTMLAIEGFDNGTTQVPLAFIQHKSPKILQEDLSPVEWPKNPELEWNPPGHGDIYTSMVTSGTLRKLLDAGFEYAFISNSDNLGAVVDPAIYGFMVKNDLPFLMEVAERTSSDKKGGHLCRLKQSGRLALRELAQCPDDSLDTFQDVSKYCFFNTNSIWINLKILEKVFAYHGMMPLDLIVNSKHVDPRDSSSPWIYQLETAMGAAISSFRHAQVLKVPRTRFAPVKTCGDLLNVMSDNFVLTAEQTVVPNPARVLRPIEIDLDKKFFMKIDDFQARFPYGAPSLLECTSLRVAGDIVFGKNICLKGDVVIENKTDNQICINQEELEDKHFTLCFESRYVTTF